MNILMNVELDRDGGNPRYNVNVMNQVYIFLESCDLIDIWRLRNPNTRQFTWRQKTLLIQSHLDYWFASDILQVVWYYLCNSKIMVGCYKPWLCQRGG